KILKNNNLVGLRYGNHFHPWRTTNTFGKIAFRSVEVYHALRNDRWLEKQSLMFFWSHQFQHIRRHCRKALARLLLLRWPRSTRLSFRSWIRVCTENRPLNKYHIYRKAKANQT